MHQQIVVSSYARNNRNRMRKHGTIQTPRLAPSSGYRDAWLSNARDKDPTSSACSVGIWSAPRCGLDSRWTRCNAEVGSLCAKSRTRVM
jgi:hypothetical protein